MGMMRIIHVEEVTTRIRAAVQAINFHTPSATLLQLEDIGEIKRL